MVKMENCLYVWYVRIPYICILPYLCVMQYFHMLYMSKDIAKLLRLSQNEVALRYGIRRKE